MIMVDNNKAVLVGQADNIALEVAFLIDKLCSDNTMGSKASYDEVQGMVLREVKKLRIERDNGQERSHPHESGAGAEQTTNSRMTAAEEALEKAMQEIKKMKAEKKKIKKAKKKDR